MNKGQRSMILAAVALAGLPLAVARCNVHGSSPDLDQYDHPVEAGEEASASDEAATGSDDAESDDAASDASSDANKDGSAKEGGDGGDAGDASEEPPACSTPLGGAACTSHSVACGSSSCTTPTDVCCATSFSAGAPTGTCTAAATGCLGTTDVACEEAADCASGQVCCQTVAAISNNLTATCQTSCLGSYQICRSTTECTTGQCTPQSCGIGATYDIEACGLQTGCTATN
jgi:hypothetical protein